MSEGANADLSFYCKAYRFGELRRFHGFPTELLVDQDARTLTDDDVVFLHPNFCVTRSVFLPRRIERTASSEWIEFCKQQLKFEIPPDLAETTPYLPE